MFEKGRRFRRFDECFWDADTPAFGYVPADADSMLGKFGEIVNCKPLTGEPVLMALLGPPYAQHVEGSLSDEEVVDEFLSVARRLADLTPGWGRKKALPAVAATLVTRWEADPYARGSYSFLPVGAAPTDRASLAAPIEDTCFWCGEATHLRYPVSPHRMTIGQWRFSAAPGRCSRALELQVSKERLTLTKGACPDVQHKHKHKHKHTHKRTHRAASLI